MTNAKGVWKMEQLNTLTNKTYFYAEELPQLQLKHMYDS
jgi:hypothetical protein